MNRSLIFVGGMITGVTELVSLWRGIKIESYLRRDYVGSRLGYKDEDDIDLVKTQTGSDTYRKLFQITYL